MIEEADLLLVMEDHHRAAILRLDQAASDRTFLISEFATDDGARGPGINDPIGQDQGAYLDVFQRLDDYITRAMPRIEASVVNSSRR